MTRRYVLTGGSGFVGTELIRQLKDRGENIINLDLKKSEAFPEVEIVQGDIREQSNLERLKLGPSDVVVHLAARQFGEDVPRRKTRDEWFREVNVGGTELLLKEMQRCGASRLIFFSTDMTYGLPKKLPVPETAEQHPLGPYGRSKLEAEKLLRCAEGVRSTIFRPRLIIGPGRLGVLTKLFTLIRKNLPVPMIGSGKNCYQMVSVSDCAKAAILASEKGCPDEVFNLGSSNPPTSRELLKSLIKSAGSHSVLFSTSAPFLKMTLNFLDKIGHPLLYPEQFLIADAEIILDTLKVHEKLGWKGELLDSEMMRQAYVNWERN